MEKPRIQFGMPTLFIGTAFSAVAVCGMTSAYRQMQSELPTLPLTIIPAMLVIAGPFWIPFAFIAYAAGSRQVTWRMVFCLLAVEIASIVAMNLQHTYAILNS